MSITDFMFNTEVKQIHGDSAMVNSHSPSWRLQLSIGFVVTLQCWGLGYLPNPELLFVGFGDHRVCTVNFTAG